MPVELEFRHFTPQDLDALHFLLADALPAEARPRFAQLVNLLLAEDVAAMVAAVVDALPVQLAGALVLRGEPDRSRAVLHVVAVHPDFRRLGLGRGLMARALAVARGSGWTSVVCPPGSGPEAAAFLPAMGFAPLAEQGDQASGWQCNLEGEG